MKLRQSPDGVQTLKLNKASIKFGSRLEPGDKPVLLDPSKGITLDSLYAIGEPKVHRLVVFVSRRSSGGSSTSRPNEFAAKRVSIDPHTGEVNFTPQDMYVDISEEPVYPVISAETVDSDQQTIAQTGVNAVRTIIVQFFSCLKRRPDSKK